ncbi:hypothetical protein AVEN_121392-1 [Araneus ventricosus]|uniref:THAP-type domain-containing protein n=1 Tax=Araneus ventricosus TaxID=182803 RepID=A0A4Y2CSU1_ARAVE|nr:hypothetical protein AVEN_121392-1 [Araneus ventricosus]
MSKRYKYCIVPKCVKTTITAPEKLFIHLPNNDALRKKWCLAMRREDKVNTKLSTSSVRHVYDHLMIHMKEKMYETPVEPVGDLLSHKLAASREVRDTTGTSLYPGASVQR